MRWPLVWRLRLDAAQADAAALETALAAAVAQIRALEAQVAELREVAVLPPAVHRTVLAETDQKLAAQYPHLSSDQRKAVAAEINRQGLATLARLR